MEARLQALRSEWVRNCNFETHDPGPQKQQERNMDLVTVRSNHEPVGHYSSAFLAPSCSVSSCRMSVISLPHLRALAIPVKGTG